MKKRVKLSVLLLVLCMLCVMVSACSKTDEERKQAVDSSQQNDEGKDDGNVSSQQNDEGKDDGNVSSQDKDEKNDAISEKTPDDGQAENDSSDGNTSDADLSGDASAQEGQSADTEAEDQPDTTENQSFNGTLPEGSLTEQTLAFDENGKWQFNVANAFSTQTVSLSVLCPEGEKVYYTLNGAVPTADSEEYTEPLVFEPQEGENPDAYVFRAVSVKADGTVSKVASRTFFVSEELDDRFTITVFSVIGDPAELTDSPKGILYGMNYKKRGRDSERAIFLEAFEFDGENILAQDAGVRVYGGYSRQYAIKSLKFYARKSYDEENGKFKFEEFETPKLDGSGKNIKKYDRLVLRSHGNDFQFCYLRDELSQALVKKAGFADYEACVPAAAYVNGKYYGFFWLHENYCDEYFKQKYGKSEGEYIVAEGSEKEKSDDEEIQPYIDEYNEKYDAFSAMNLTDDANYAQVTEFIDVENYLDYMAWNIAICNFDWPNNNYKCYRYTAAEGEAYGEGVRDGRWRYLPHDMDYSYNLYDQNTASDYFNTLKVVLDEKDKRGAPLLKKLLERADCRKYFKDRTYEFLDNVLTEECITNTYYELHNSRLNEMHYYYDYLQEVKKTDWSVWTGEDQYAGFEQAILKFAKNRASYCRNQMEELLPDIE